MDISVIIPSYNTEDTIHRTLAALSEQDFTGDYEILVVDCSSTPRVREIASAFSRVRVLREERRFNPGEGRNIGARAAEGELIVFVDADVTLAKDGLRRAFEYFQTGHRMFGGALELDEDGAGPASYLEHYFFNHESQLGRPACPRNNLSSALMVVQRSLFLESGGFRDIPRMQDTELSERLRAQGETLTFTPTLVGRQVQDSPLTKVFRKIYLNGRNLFFIRYGQSSLVKRIAFLLALPVMSALKITRIVLRHLRYQDFRKRLITIALCPLLGLAGLFWMLGFYEAVLLGRGISTER